MCDKTKSCLEIEISRMYRKYSDCQYFAKIYNPCGFDEWLLSSYNSRFGTVDGIDYKGKSVKLKLDVLANMKLPMGDHIRIDIGYMQKKTKGDQKLE